MEENFAAFRGNFCDKCPQAKLPLESSYLGGNSPGGKFPRVHLSLGAIAREVKIWGRQLFLDQLFSGAIVLWGNNPGAIIWGGGQFSSWTIVRTPHDRCKIFHYTFQFSTLLLYTLLSKLELFVVNRNFYRLRGVLNERQSGQCSYRNKYPKLYFPVFPRLKHVVNQSVYWGVNMDDWQQWLVRVTVINRLIHVNSAYFTDQKPIFNNIIM